MGRKDSRKEGIPLSVRGQPPSACGLRQLHTRGIVIKVRQLREFEPPTIICGYRYVEHPLRNDRYNTGLK